MPRCHAAATPCCCFIFRAVVFISSLFHPGPRFGQAHHFTFLLWERTNDLWTRWENAIVEADYWSWHNYSSDLGNTGWTKPISVRHLSDFGPQAVHMATTITAVTQQEALIIVSLPANLARLNREINKKKSFLTNSNLARMFCYFVQSEIITNHFSHRFLPSNGLLQLKKTQTDLRSAAAAI